MRISTPRMGAVLLFLNFFSTPLAWPSSPAITTPKIFSGSISSRPEAAVTIVSDDSKNNWSRLKLTATEKPFGVDFASFAGAQGKSYVEFYIQISYQRLSFIRAGKMFRAAYDIDFYIEDEHGNLLQTLSEVDEIIALSYDETTQPDKSRLTLLRADLLPGHYQWRAVITDRESAQSYTATSKFSVRDFSGQNLVVSDIQFSRNMAVDSSHNVFVKNNRRIEPNVSRAYGQFVGQLLIYYEIYNLVAPGNVARDSTFLQTAAADTFQTLYIIRNESGEEVKELWKFTRKPGTSCVQSVVLPITNLANGLYTLTARVFDNANHCYAESSSRFAVQWGVFSCKDQKYEDIIDALRYVAKSEELNHLKKLPVAERQRGLLEFWQRHDPTPGTPRNEAMEEYNRRMEFVNANFKWQQGAGWKSPQGQTYLTYGPPDNVRRFNSTELSQLNDRLKTPEWSAHVRQGLHTPATNGNASSFYSQYEIWEYRGLNRRFVFVDARGVGNYEFINPLVLNALGLR